METSNNKKGIEIRITFDEKQQKVMGLEGGQYPPSKLLRREAA
jgi:hypothetical protein